MAYSFNNKRYHLMAPLLLRVSSSIALFALATGNAGAGDAVTFAEASPLGTIGDLTQTITLGDLDGDDTIDVVSSPNFSIARYFLNNGSTDPFAGVEGVALEAAGIVNGAAIGDVNGDGHADIVFWEFNGPTTLLLNNGNALEPFAGVQPLVVSPQTASTTEVELADMNGDERLDILIANTNIAVNRLYLNNGTADPFANVDALDIGPTTGYSDGLAVMDVDGDGDNDVAVANGVTGFGATLEVFLNNGTADPFASVVPIELATSIEYYDVQLADFTGDDLPDLAAVRPGRIDIFVNNGSSTPYTPGDTVFLTDIESGFLIPFVARDMNFDGAVDVVAAADVPFPGSDTVKIFLNNGTIDPFAERIGSDIGPVFIFRGLGVDDINGDNMPDIVAGNTAGPDRLFLGAVGPDTIPPVVSLRSPEQDETIFDTVTLSAFAADNLELGSVTFLANQLVLAARTEPPYEYELDTNLLANGLASITAVALDAASNVSADSVSVFVANISDTDADFIPDELDNCLLVPNTPQRDTDADGIGNACDADLTNDCMINFLDLNVLKQRFFSTDPDADLNGDGVVNFIDLEAMRAVFFGVPGPSGTANLCE